MRDYSFFNRLLAFLIQNLLHRLQFEMLHSDILLLGIRTPFLTWISTEYLNYTLNWVKSAMYSHGIYREVRVDTCTQAYFHLNRRFKLLTGLRERIKSINLYAYGPPGYRGQCFLGVRSILVLKSGPTILITAASDRDWYSLDRVLISHWSGYFMREWVVGEWKYR